MGNLNQEIKHIIIPKSFIDYHCLKWGEIHLLHFKHYDINLICSTQNSKYTNRQHIQLY